MTILVLNIKAYVDCNFSFIVISLTIQVREMKLSHEEVLTQKDTIETKLASERAEIDLLINKKTALLSKRDELMKKIRDLGSVPSDVDKYSRKSIRDLKAILSKCNQELQKYGHVNKKALDQV